MLLRDHRVTHRSVGRTLLDEPRRLHDAYTLNLRAATDSSGISARSCGVLETAVP